MEFACLFLITVNNSVLKVSVPHAISDMTLKKDHALFHPQIPLDLQILAVVIGTGITIDVLPALTGSTSMLMEFVLPLVIFVKLMMELLELVPLVSMDLLLLKECVLLLTPSLLLMLVADHGIGTIKLVLPVQEIG